MFSNLSRRRVALLLLLTSTLLLTIDRNSNPVVDRLRNVMSKVVEPFDAAGEAISRPLANAWGAITEYDELVAENERLRDENQRRKGAEISARSSNLLAQSLLSQYDLLEEFSTVKVGVVGQAPSSLQNTVQINKGSSQGLRVGMPVVAGGGLIGKITKVYDNSAVVLLVVDPQYFIGAEVLSVADDSAVTTTTVDPDTTTVSGNDPGATTTSSTTSTTLPGAPSTTQPSNGGVTPSSVPPTGSSTTTIAPVVVRRETGIIGGQGASKPLLLEFASDFVNIGDVVITSGGAGQSVAPQGLLIGEVTRIIPKPGTRSVLVEVTPTADLSNLVFLDVVLFVPSAGG